MSRKYDRIVKRGELIFGVRFERDEDMQAPWEEHDGHGIVIDWTTETPDDGQDWRVLTRERIGRSTHYYDFNESVQIAIRDQWGTEDGKRPGETDLEYATRAVEADYEYLRAWCNDEWEYVFVAVELIEPAHLRSESYRDSCGGVETYKNYHETHANEVIDGLVQSIMVDRAKVLEMAGPNPFGL